jgi:hypothetical protein
MNHGAHTVKCVAQGPNLERRPNDCRPAGQLVRRLRPHNGPNRDPARDEVRDQMAADETGRAGHRDGRKRIVFVHVSAFS